MPKVPTDYSKTIIYKLVHKEDYDNANIYIGSTTYFVNRRYSHKRGCNNEKSNDYNDKKYQYIRNNGGWGEWYMIEVEKFPCNDSNEARAREEYWRCHFNSQLNTIRAYRTGEEKKEQDKERYEQNKDKIAEHRKEYREQNKDKLLEQKKAYYEQNKDKILAQIKKKYEDNKDITNEKITCECGCMIRRKNLQGHKKRQIHLDLISKINHTDIN